MPKSKVQTLVRQIQREVNALVDSADKSQSSRHIPCAVRLKTQPIYASIRHGGACLLLLSAVSPLDPSAGSFHSAARLTTASGRLSDLVTPFVVLSLQIQFGIGHFVQYTVGE